MTHDSSTDKALMFAFALAIVIMGIYSKNEQLIGGSMVISGFAIRALTYRVTDGEVK